MTSDPLVYIVIVNWNGRDITLDCLASLSAVTYANFRTVVVDNASSDGSAEAIRNRYPGVEVLPMQENRRFAGGNNAGIRHALSHGADLLLLLNNDTTVEPQFLSALVTRLRRDNRLGVAAPMIYYFDQPDRIWFAGGSLSMWTGTMRHIGIREFDAGQFAAARPIDYATGCCILTKRTVIERVGDLDERYFMYAEDADWCMRVRRAGFGIFFEPEARVWHKLSVSAGGHLSWFKLKHKFLSNLRFFGRYASWYHWLVFPWMNLIVNAISAVRYILTSRR